MTTHSAAIAALIRKRERLVKGKADPAKIAELDYELATLGYVPEPEPERFIPEPEVKHEPQPPKVDKEEADRIAELLKKAQPEGRKVPEKETAEVAPKRGRPKKAHA